jgi:hypothetical protein
MNYFRRQLKRRQCIVNMLTAIGFINLFALIGHVYASSPTWAIIHAIAGTVAFFAASNEAHELSILRKKHNL